MKLQRNQPGAWTRARYAETGLDLIRRSMRMALQMGLVVSKKFLVAEVQGGGEMLAKILVGIILIALRTTNP